ncbi:hypothetical protein BS78_03G418700 [Paspalum vaginatum]|nr:hypothetical protein BS78_03G418700 [Paspalum vaginatum]
MALVCRVHVRHRVPSTAASPISSISSPPTSPALVKHAHREPFPAHRRHRAEKLHLHHLAAGRLHQEAVRSHGLPRVDEEEDAAVEPDLEPSTRATSGSVATGGSSLYAPVARSNRCISPRSSASTNAPRLEPKGTNQRECRRGAGGARRVGRGWRVPRGGTPEPGPACAAAAARGPAARRRRAAAAVRVRRGQEHRRGGRRAGGAARGEGAGRGRRKGRLNGQRGTDVDSKVHRRTFQKKKN